MTRANENTGRRLIPIGLIPLKEFALRHGRDPATFRQKALRGGFQTAQKIGRDWLIDEDEVLTDHRIRSGNYKDWRKKTDDQ